MDSVAEQVCMSAGNLIILNNDGAAEILDILHGHFAPDAVDAVYKEVVRFLHFERMDLSMEVSLLGFDVPRRKAESRMQLGANSP